MDSRNVRGIDPLILLHARIFCQIAVDDPKGGS